MSTTLEEFLVSLGFRVDEASWKRYTSYVALASKTTAELGSVAVETATAIEVSVARVARQYESLYYVSARTSQSAQYIQSAQFAFRQMGLSADDATSAIEGVAAAMRLNPGLKGLFGGATKPEDIVDKLRGLPYFVAARLGGMAGINEKVFQHYWMFGAQERADAADHARRWKSAFGPTTVDQVDQRFLKFSKTLNVLEDDLGTMATKIGMDWVDPVEKGVLALDHAVQWFNRVDEVTRNWGVSLAGARVSLYNLFSLGGTVGGSWIATMLVKKLFGLGGGGGEAVAATAGKAELATVAEEAGATFMSGFLRGAMRFGLGPLGFLLGMTSPANEDEAKRPWNKPLGAPSSLPRGVTSQRMADGLQKLMDAGYSREAAIGIMAGLHSESGLDPLAYNGKGGGRGAQGLPQLRGDRIDEASKFLGKPWASASFDEQMNYVVWALGGGGSDFGAKRAGQRLRAPGIGAGEASDAFIRLFERSGDAGELVKSRSLAEHLSRGLPDRAEGGGSVVVTQKNEINFHGDHGQVTKDDIRRVMRDSHQELVRYASGSLR